MRLVLLLLLMPVVLAAWIAITLALPLPAAFPPAWSDGRNLFAAITTGLMGVGGVTGIAAFALHELARAGSCLDETFSAEGLAPAGRLLFARQFEGALKDRKATASLHPPFALQPWRLVVSVEARPMVRMALGWPRPLTNTRELHWHPQDDLELAGCIIHSQDRATAQRLLDSPAFASGLAPFLATGDSVGAWEIHLDRDRIWLRIRAYRLEGNTVARWLKELGDLAEVTEVRL